MRTKTFLALTLLAILCTLKCQGASEYWTNYPSITYPDVFSSDWTLLVGGMAEKTNHQWSIVNMAYQLKTNAQAGMLQSNANLNGWSQQPTNNFQPHSSALDQWAGVVPSSYEPHSANLDSWSTIGTNYLWTLPFQLHSANLDDWSAISTTTKENQSANLDAWSLLSTSSKQDHSVFLDDWVILGITNIDPATLQISSGILTVIGGGGGGVTLGQVSNVVTGMTIALDPLSTNNQINLFGVGSSTNIIPVHLGSNMGFTTNGDGTLNLNSTASGGGGSATNLSLLTSNYFNINTNLVIMDLATVQTLNLNLETNANVMISNAWNLTNFHGSDAQFGTWNDTNGTWKLNSMQVAGGLLKTNSSAWRGTNANQMDQAILRLDSTLTNVVVTWSATNLQPPQSFTNSLAGGGGGGGGGGGAFTLIAHGATNATANTSKSITLDTTGSKLYVVGVGWSGGNVTISDGGDTFTPLIQAATGGVAWSNQVFYALNPTQVGASVTFTVQVPSGSGYPNMCIAAFADTGTGPMLDVTNGFNGDGTGHNSLTFPTLTPTSTNELGVVSVFWNNSLSLTNIDSGYTISDAYANTEGMAYIIETTGVAKGPTLKFNGNTDVNAGTQVFFLP